MSVSIKDVRLAINELYQSDIASLLENTVHFSIQFGEYHGAVYVGLYNKYPGDSDAVEQSLEVTFIPVDEAGDDLRYPGRSFVDIVLLCNELQHALDWGAAVATEDPDNTIIVTFGRNINTSLSDLAKTADGDHESELATALNLMSEEFKLVAPIMRNFAAGIASLEIVKLLLQAPSQSSVQIN